MKVAIITDGNSGFTKKEAKQLGLYIVKMPIILDGTVRFENEDIGTKEFYKNILEYKTISTSQPAPADVIAIWETALKDGFDEIVYIPMSSGLSNSLQSAKMLAEDYPKVHVVDNHRISVTQRHSVMDAIYLAGKGYGAEEIKNRLEENAFNSVVFLGVETLEFFKRGGRVSAAAAMMGTLLNLKPLLKTTGGAFDPIMKVRGTKQCMQREIEQAKAYVEEMKQKGFEHLSIGVAGTFAHDKEADEWLQMVQKTFPNEETFYNPLTISVGCHTGPEAFGMGISAVERD